MRLAIFSDCDHTKSPEGEIGSDVHILVRQMEALAAYFSEVHIFCPFIPYSKEIPITTYKNKNIHFLPLTSVGGNTLADKIKIIKQIPIWFKAYKKANSLSDIVYQRFPNNLNIPGFFYFFIIRKKVFATYTGTWDENQGQSFSYILQKWLLKHFYRGPIGVYSISNFLPSKIFKSFSPSYSLIEWNEEFDNVAEKVKSIINNGLPKLSMITVGSFIEYKNQQYILDTCLLLKNHEIQFHLFMVGDGVLRSQYQQFISDNSLGNQITITGKLNYTEVRKLYRKTDFVIQAPTLEGFGKVPVEGYFHGTLPIINNISLAGYLTQENTLGFLFSANEKKSLFDVLMFIQKHPNVVANRIQDSRLFAKQFTLESWAEEYNQRIKSYYSNFEKSI